MFLEPPAFPPYPIFSVSMTMCPKGWSHQKTMISFFKTVMLLCVSWGGDWQTGSALLMLKTAPNQYNQFQLGLKHAEAPIGVRSSNKMGDFDGSKTRFLWAQLCQKPQHTQNNGSAYQNSPSIWPGEYPIGQDNSANIFGLGTLQ